MNLFNMIVRCSILIDCSTANSDVTPTLDLTRYTTAYIEQLDSDVHNLRSFIMSELRDMGLYIGDKPPQSPVPTDLLVRFTYCDGWHLGRYLKKLQVQLMDCLSQSVVYTASYQVESNGGARELE